ncbi:diaminopimelate epimerase [Actinokineospora spheciospongiae]|uniref:diaminopimelate epimerase n=1 Tax=Actinokineospora spheciospongiae TaxID=909613 RepID=UPI000D70AF4F|nr:diaminopimelate epimerase [Actinokineospora spheciospongiae]PWW58459.1 diaminopimelate epimerase [Actinokineospora spheciospongiae]
MAIEFRKGHGTENDFVLLPDPDGDLDLTGARVRALCDRGRGLGADGVLRVIRTKALPDAPEGIDGDVWFMDYRNADGSLAEMCGNGVRVFARHLSDQGLVDGPVFPVGTRAGLRPATVHPDGQVTVDMGPVRRTGRSETTVTGRTYPGLGIDVGNPHLACVTDDVPTLDLTTQPDFDRAVFPNGVNLEFVQPLGADEVRMRVHERGVGETRSCGTGTVAAAAAALAAQDRTTGTVTVHVPGGTVTVEITETGSTLTGPAAFVAQGELDQAWWDAQV